EDLEAHLQKVEESFGLGIHDRTIVHRCLPAYKKPAPRCVLTNGNSWSKTTAAGWWRIYVISTGGPTTPIAPPGNPALGREDHEHTASRVFQCLQRRLPERREAARRAFDIVRSGHGGSLLPGRATGDAGALP